jgi:Tfp pilus assembly protein PilN
MNTSVGLDLGAEGVKVVVLKKLRNRIRLAKFGEEKIAAGVPSRESVVPAIRKLFDRLQIRQKEVTIHFGGVGVRLMVVDAPLLAPAELLDWVRHHCSERLPKTANVAQLIFSYHVLQQTDHGLKVMVAYCQPHVLQEKLEWVEAAGLQPVMVGAGELDLFLAFAFDREDLFNRTLLFLDLRATGAAFLITAAGNPGFYRENGFSADRQIVVSHVQSEIQKVLASWQPENRAPIDKIILVGDEAEQQAILPSGIPIEAGVPLQGLLKPEENLSPRFSLAAGLALKKYYPLLNTIDLLPDEKKTKIKQQNEKQRALRVTLAGGSLILLCWLALSLLKLIVTEKLEVSQEQLLALESQIAAYEQLQKEQTQLQQALFDVQRLVTQRSQYAQLLEEISRLMPEGVWLHEIAVTPRDTVGDGAEKTRRSKVQLRGWAFDEGKVAVLLGELEGSRYVSEVRLLATTRVAASEVWQRSKLRKIPLVEFRITSVTK